MTEPEILDESVKNRILTAAKEEFFSKGYDGARMQKIADNAEINKAMLYYYFKNKDTLFIQIFSSSFASFFPAILEAFNSDRSFFDKIKLYFNIHISFLEENPSLPLFLNCELSKGNVKMKKLFPYNKKKEFFLLFSTLVNNEIRAKRIRQIDPMQLFISMLSLSIFPFISKSVLTVGFQMDAMEYEMMIETRKTFCAEFIINSIKI